MKNLCQLDDGKSQMTKIPKKHSLALNAVADLPDICEIPDIYEDEDLICDVQIFSAKICNFVVFQSSLVVAVTKGSLGPSALHLRISALQCLFFLGL
jgi:hypothetical protein